jgi:AcrR family transcriptional regulator
MLERYSKDMSSVKGQHRGPRRPAPGRSRSTGSIAAAAHRLFLERGYAGTTIESIAEEAGVAVQTIYNTVGVKSAVLEMVLDTTAAGSGATVPVRDLMARRTDQVASAAGVVAVLADWFVEVHERTAEVFRVIRDAAAVDPEIAAIDRRRAAQRFANYHLAAEEIARRSQLAPGLDVAGAAAVIWSVGSPQTYRLLVIEQGWDVARYRRWVEVTLTAALLS